MLGNVFETVTTITKSGGNAAPQVVSGRASRKTLS